ncbi:hypothetical protein A2V49_02360 [candidate division WWE3 bacterium RBG_19FT_COMBO_34_6]|uniref:Large ribosomal subunit protein bL25 n=1 Tax=candidate division WWE3 bacterium RBG_19FT_COMBO_34_6 TaxID=1802612 RepID=A0A1F4UKG1_UNCKA|nr:MAG: hypothetical protein A2V49_02360 [candidate division WWE3 bacterium RBG_19FT_COMBO_34_6]
MELIGKKREIFGKKTKNLRFERLIPAAIFGKNLEPLSITINYNDFVKVYQESGETSLIDLMVDGKKHPVLVKEVQIHHITSSPIHVGFYEVNLKEKITAEIPVEIINEDQNNMIKSGEALVLLRMNEIEVKALPTDFPDSFEIDATLLVDMNSEITVKDLSYDREKVEIFDLEPDEVVAKLEPAQMQEEEEEEQPVEEAEAIAGLEALSEKPAEEGEEGEEEKEE